MSPADKGIVIKNKGGKVVIPNSGGVGDVKGTFDIGIIIEDIEGFVVCPEDFAFVRAGDFWFAESPAAGGSTHNSGCPFFCHAGLELEDVLAVGGPDAVEGRSTA